MRQQFQFAYRPNDIDPATSPAVIGLRSDSLVIEPQTPSESKTNLCGGKSTIRNMFRSKSEASNLKKQPKSAKTYTTNAGEYVQVLWDEDPFEVEMEFEGEWDENCTQKLSVKAQVQQRIERIKGQLEAEMKIVEGVPGSKINKKHNMKALAKINAKSLAKEIGREAKTKVKMSKRWRSKKSLKNLFDHISTNEVAVRLMEKSDFEFSKGYYDLQVLNEDYDSVKRNQVLIKRHQYSYFFGAQQPDEQNDYIQIVAQSVNSGTIIGVAALNIERILYGKDHSMKKKEANVSKLMFTENCEHQSAVQLTLVKALEELAWFYKCDLIKIPCKFEQRVVDELDYFLVLRAGHSFYMKSRLPDGKSRTPPPPPSI